MPLEKTHTLVFTFMKIVGMVMVLAGVSLLYNAHLGAYIGLNESLTKILGLVIGVIGLFDLFLMPKIVKNYWKRQDKHD